MDFRGQEQFRARGQYADAAIHAELIYLNGPLCKDFDMHIELFVSMAEGFAACAALRLAQALSRTG